MTTHPSEPSSTRPIVGREGGGEDDPASTTSPAQTRDGWDALRTSRMWPAATLFLGGSLWAQLSLVALWSELRFVDARAWAVLLYLAPLGLLGAGVWTRRAPLLLMGFLVALLPGLAMMPDPEQRMLMEAGSMARIGASLALFIGVASAGSGAPREAHVATPLDAATVASSSNTRGAVAQDRRFVLIRLAVLVVLLVVPAHAVFINPQIGATLSRSYGESAAAARTFLGLGHLFAWSVAAYLMVLTPALHLEYDRRKLERQLDDTARAWTGRRIGLRILMWFGITGVAALLLAWWR